MDDLSAITRKVIELKLDQNIYTIIEEILWNENAKSISAAAYNFIVETGISEDVADLVQDGYFGFLKAIDTYDPVEHPDISFSTWVIIKCVGEWAKYLRDGDPLVSADSLDSQLSCSEKDTTADKNA